MGLSGLLGNRQFRLAAIVMGVLLAALLAASVIVESALPPTPLVSDVGVVLCALIGSSLLVRAWRGMQQQEVASRIWGLVTLGIVLWAMAEVAWAFYELVLQVEIPYPSFADLFWLSGYVPIYVALVLRARSFTSSAPPSQRWAVAAFTVLYSLLLFFAVGLQLIQGFDPSRLAESLVNTAYPLADWGLCVLTLLIIFSLERGRFANVWRLFGIGVFLMGSADLLFFFADWNGLYYPDGHLTVVSAITDLLYNSTYLVIGLSGLAYTLVAGAIQHGTISLALQSKPKMNVLVFVAGDGRIISVSDNFMSLVRSASTAPYLSMPLDRALGLEPAQGTELLGAITRRTPLKSLQLVFKNSQGQRRQVSATSLIMPRAGGDLDLIALVLRADAPAAGEPEYPLHEDQRMLIQHYLEKNTVSQSQESGTLRSYFLAQVNLLHSLVEQFSGEKLADTMLDRLDRASRTRGWQVAHSGLNIQLPEDVEGQPLADMLLVLLEEARGYAIDMTDQRMVEQEMKSLDRTLDADDLAIVDKYRLRPSVTAAIQRSLAGARVA